MSPAKPVAQAAAHFMIANARRAVCALCIVLGPCLPAMAAPAEDKPVDAPPSASNESGVTKSVERLGMPDVSSGSRTVDMLIELQGKQPGLTIPATERAAARSEIASIRNLAAPQPVLSSTPAHQSALFGGGIVSSEPLATPAAAAPGREPQWRSAAAERGLEGLPPGPSAAAPTAPRSGRAPEEDVLGPLRTAIGWIREHRNWVIAGALALLVALGGASRGMASRRR